MKISVIGFVRIPSVRAVWVGHDVRVSSGMYKCTLRLLLSAGGEYVYLSHGFNVHDQVAFGPQIANISYARCPDAGLDFATIIPTPLANNNCNIGVQEIAALQVQVHPNPFLDVLHIESHEEQVQINVRNLNGQLLQALQINAGKYQLDASAWASGLYLIEIQSTGLPKSFKFVKS